MSDRNFCEDVQNNEYIEWCAMERNMLLLCSILLHDYVISPCVLVPSSFPLLPL